MSVERDGGRVACEQPIELRFRASCLVALVSCCSHEEKWGRGGGGVCRFRGDGIGQKEQK